MWASYRSTNRFTEFGYLVDPDYLWIIIEKVYGPINKGTSKLACGLCPYISKIYPNFANKQEGLVYYICVFYRAPIHVYIVLYITLFLN